MNNPSPPPAKPARVAHLTSVHPTFDTRIFVKECRSVANSPFGAALVACHSHDECVDGVQIYAIARPRGRLARMFRTSTKVFRRALESGAEVFHFHDPELIPVGLALKALGKKVVYDVHEDVPKQIVAKEWLHPLARRPTALAAAFAEWLAGQLLDHIVTATPAIAERFPSRKTTIVQNFPLKDELVFDDPVPYRTRPMNVVYIGGITRARAASEMVKAIDAIETPGLRFKMAGPWLSNGLEEELQSVPGWSKTDYLGVIDRATVRETLAGARVGLVTFLPRPNHLLAYPNKMFEYMAAGVPVIASHFPLWRTIIEETGAGLTVDPAKPDEIADAISWIMDNPGEAEEMGRRGREAVITRYHWGSEEAKLIGIYSRLGISAVDTSPARPNEPTASRSNHDPRHP